MTTEQRRCREAVREWAAKRGMKLTHAPRHVHPRDYVVGYAAPACLVVAHCWLDSEPQLREWDRKYPLDTINTFDQGLRPGDWCITAYLRMEGIAETVAIPIAEESNKPGKKRG